MTIVVLHWKEWLEDLRVEVAPAEAEPSAVEAAVDRLPPDRTAFILNTAGSFTDPISHLSGPRLVELYNALAESGASPVSKFQDKDTGLRRVGLRLIELARTAPVFQLAAGSAQPKKERKKMSDDQTNGAAKGRKRNHTEAQVITVLVDKNPKREGSSAHERFNLYRTGMTVSQYVEAGGRTGDLTYDEKHSFISVQ